MVIACTAVSDHRAAVNVAPGLDLDCVDLGDALAALSEVGFTGVGHEGIMVRPVEHDSAALLFDPVWCRWDRPVGRGPVPFLNVVDRIRAVRLGPHTCNRCWSSVAGVRRGPVARSTAGSGCRRCLLAGS